jgi:hypothetical protein
VTDLCEALRPITEDHDRVKFSANAEASILVEADTAFALGIVLTELVTNAVKYAFPPPRSGTIQANVRRGDPERLEVSIKDDGIGMASFREGSLGQPRRGERRFSASNHIVACSCEHSLHLNGVRDLPGSAITRLGAPHFPQIASIRVLPLVTTRVLRSIASFTRRSASLRSSCFDNAGACCLRMIPIDPLKRNSYAIAVAPATPFRVAQRGVAALL